MRQREQCGSAAGDHREHQVSFREPGEEAHDCAGVLRVLLGRKRVRADKRAESSKRPRLHIEHNPIRDCVSENLLKKGRGIDRAFADPDKENPVVVREGECATADREVAVDEADFFADHPLGEHGFIPRFENRECVAAKQGGAECVEVLNDRKIHIFLSQYIMECVCENKKSPQRMLRRLRSREGFRNPQ